ARLARREEDVVDLEALPSQKVDRRGFPARLDSRHPGLASRREREIGTIEGAGAAAHVVLERGSGDHVSRALDAHVADGLHVLALLEIAQRVRLDVGVALAQLGAALGARLVALGTFESI